METATERKVHGRAPGAPLIGIEEGVNTHLLFQIARTLIGQRADKFARGGVIGAAIRIRFKLHVEMQELILNHISRTPVIGTERVHIADSFEFRSHISFEDGTALADLHVW